jgi:hypothetical protein
LSGPHLLLLVRLFSSIAFVPAIVFSVISRFLSHLLQFLSLCLQFLSLRLHLLIDSILALPFKLIHVFIFQLFKLAVGVSEVQ